MRYSLTVIAALVLVSCTPSKPDVQPTQTGTGIDLAQILERVEQNSKATKQTTPPSSEWPTPDREKQLQIALNAIRTARFTPPSKIQTETFGLLTAFVGKSFRGIPGGDADAKADIQRWSWALGGAAIKISHAIEDGSYGGDTYVYKDAATSDLVYVYITNAGFRTEGTITLNEDGSYTADEAVTGHPSITRVRSTSRLNEDGSSSMTSEMFENDEWRPGQSFTYQPTREPLPVLKAPE